MGRKRVASELYVYMNNQHVGILSRLSSGQLNFCYESNWLKEEFSRPISLSLPLSEKPYTGDLVYNFFDNLLPDNESLRTRIQRRLGADSNQCFDLLSRIGADCVGALQLLSRPIEANASKILAEKVSDQKISAILKNYYNSPLGMSPDEDFRISIAGAQEKTAFLWYKGHWCVPKSMTPTTHIFKLPIGKIDHSGIDLSQSIENEWLCLQILKQYNISVPEASIYEYDGAKALICERFDRKWNENKKEILRLPQEDMCQAKGLSSSNKYESEGGPGIEVIMNFLNGSLDSIKDRHLFFKTCFLFWVLGAIDGHAKNFSIFIKPQGRYNLTPVYDVLSAYPLTDNRQLEIKKIKMAMSVRGKSKHYHWSVIRKRHWHEMGEICKLDTKFTSDMMSQVFDTMGEVIENVKEILPKSFPNQIAEAVFKGMHLVKNKN